MCDLISTIGQYTVKNTQGSCYEMSSSSSGYYSITFPKGSYLIELWGSSAGTTTSGQQNPGGKGGYVSGRLSLPHETNFYFYVGTAGTDSNRNTPGNGGYNGGAQGAIDSTSSADCATAGSGGATDMRYVSGEWNLEASLKSRIMVAAGGGSSGCASNAGLGGHAGGLEGENGGDNKAKTQFGGQGGNQTYGYKLGEGERGEFGDESGGSGGAGYWGGKKGKASNVASVGYSGSGGGGGSSYISGYKTCVYNIFSFTRANMIPGNKRMPSTTAVGQYELEGHTGNGYVRITAGLKYVNCLQSCHCRHNTLSYGKACIILIVMSP